MLLLSRCSALSAGSAPDAIAAARVPRGAGNPRGAGSGRAASVRWQRSNAGLGGGGVALAVPPRLVSGNPPATATASCSRHMAQCALTVYWPEGAAAPQEAAAPLLGWAWLSQARRGAGERCTVVAAAPSGPRCSGAEPQCVGAVLPPGGAAARRRRSTGGDAEAFVVVSALSAGAPSALELWIRGQRVLDVDLVVVLYKARTPALRLTLRSG